MNDAFGGIGQRKKSGPRGAAKMPQKDLLLLLA